MFLLLTFTAFSKDSFDCKQVNFSWVLKRVVFYIWDHIIKLVVDEHLYYCAKCPNTEFFLFRIFLFSAQIHENKDQKKNPYLDNFHAAGCYDLRQKLCILLHFTSSYNIVSIIRRNHILHAFFAVQYIVLKHEQNIEKY